MHAERGWPHTKRVRRLVVLAGIVAGLYIGHAPALRSVAAAISVDAPLERAHYVLPLYQAPDSLVPEVERLLREGYAPAVLLYRTRPSRLEAIGVVASPKQIWRELLRAQQVPEARIVEVPHVTLTYRNVFETVARGHRAGDRLRVLVLTSRPFGRIALMDLRRASEGLPIELRIHSVTPPGFDDGQWWKSSAGLISYFDAYTLWVLRLLR